MPTAVAPSAKRLEDVSAAPDATVEKHRDAAARGRNHFGQTVERGAQRLFVATAVVGDDETVGAVLDRNRSVFSGDDALDQKPAFHDSAQSVEKGRREIRRRNAGDARDIEAGKQRSAPPHQATGGRMAGVALTIVSERRALECLDVACSGRVHSQHDGRASGFLRAAHESLRHREIIRRVKLLPDRGAARGHDIFRTGRCARGQHELRRPALRGARHSDLGLGMERAHRGNRGCVERARPGRAENR